MGHALCPSSPTHLYNQTHHLLNIVHTTLHTNIKRYIENQNSNTEGVYRVKESSAVLAV